MSVMSSHTLAQTDLFRIERFAFGALTIRGLSYGEDVLILPDRVLPHWSRQEEHLVRLGDLTEALAEVPEVLLIGTGTQQSLKIAPELMAHTRSIGLELLAFDTRTTCAIYNQLLGKRRIAAAFHLTC